MQKKNKERKKKPIQFSFTKTNVLMFMCVNGKLGIRIRKSFGNNIFLFVGALTNVALELSCVFFSD